MKRILSIDGGGIRGLIPAVICRQLEEWSGKPIHRLFDLIAGSSTGGIIAMALALPPSGKPASDLVDFYRQDGVKIFSRPRGKARYFKHPKFDNAELKRVLEKKFATAKVSEAIVDVLVTTYDIKFRVPFNISRRTAKARASDDYLMRDVAIATSAAPTYFSPSILGDRVLVDGGIVANNPACLAIAEARQLWPGQELLLVSLGTGTLAKPIRYETAVKWGLIGWATPLIDCIFDGTAKATENFLNREIDGERYWRFQYGLNESTQTLDGVSEAAITGLMQIGQQIIREDESRLKRVLELFIQEDPDQIEAAHTREALRLIDRGVRQSLSIKNRIFIRGVHNKLTEMFKDVDDWQKGTIQVPADDQGRFLVDLYGEAKKSVFATRLKRFSGTFRGSSLPDDILRANRKAAVPTTRIFVFDTANDVSGFDYCEMVRQQEAGIDVRVLVRSSASVDPEDFTIIDESALGITKFIGPRDAAARWTFDDRMAIGRFLQMRDQLIVQSVPFAKFADQSRVRYKLWNDQALVDVSESNIESYQRLSREYFGNDAADDARVLRIQQQVGGGIYLLQRHIQSESRSVGILSLVPVSLQGFRRLEADKVKGAEFTSGDILGAPETHALAHYLGAIAGIDRIAMAALVDCLESSILELTHDGVESIFARPVTDDGLRLLRHMHWEGPGADREPLMNRVCRLRLG